MNLLQDVVGGWRARPLLFAAKVLLGFTLSLLICGGRWMLHKADAESQRLLQTWPADQCTLLLPDDPAADLFRDLQARLPPDSWLATRIEGNSVWILGSLPADFFQGRGHSLSPDLIQRCEAVALLAEGVDPALGPGDLLKVDGQAYRIYGVGRFPLPAEAVLPLRARNLQDQQVDQVTVRLPASRLQPLIQDLLIWRDLKLVDHQEKRFQVQAGFRKLRRNLSGLGFAAALGVALLLQALYQAEIRERKSEFALRRSLGARPQDIRNQLLLEALLGTALPVIVGGLLFLPALPHTILLGALTLITLWLLLCALLPAHQAARLNPGDALKGE